MSTKLNSFITNRVSKILLTQSNLHSYDEQFFYFIFVKLLYFGLNAFF